jgi:hypothetical protein
MAFVWWFFFVRNTLYTVPRKDKYVLIVCTDAHCNGFFVNSTINPFTSKHPELLACQVPLKASDYRFLQHDSYLDCSQLFPFDSDELLDGRGSVTEQTKAEVKRAVAGAVTIPQKYKDLVDLM